MATIRAPPTLGVSTGRARHVRRSGQRRHRVDGAVHDRRRRDEVRQFCSTHRESPIHNMFREADGQISPPRHPPPAALSNPTAAARLTPIPGVLAAQLHPPSQRRSRAGTPMSTMPGTPPPDQRMPTAAILQHALRRNFSNGNAIAATFPSPNDDAGADRDPHRAIGRSEIAWFAAHYTVDVPVLGVALRLPHVGYIGVMGSRRARADRIIRVREVGLADAEWNRPAGPIGGAGTPEETAASIAAETIACCRRGGRRPLTKLTDESTTIDRRAFLWNSPTRSP
jgi:xanthine/CO dehydrogenase XdhC/CoxF family maturation factor